MFTDIAIIFVETSLIFLSATALALMAVGAVRAGLGLGRAAVALCALAASLALWATAMGPLAKAGILMPPSTLMDPPFALMPLIGGAVILWSLGKLTITGRTVLSGLDQRHLMGFQVFRVMGAFFLIGWATGDIPWEFALPAGVGDVLAGLAAMQALRALSKNAPDARAKVIRANVVGLADFAVAVGTGILTTEGFMHLLSLDAPNIINMYPLALFPAFIVPVFIAFHLFSLDALRRDKPVQVPA
ncbi:hypothetical protein EOI86_14905 [Hwanghaeella grinnelliae]|uniref:Uncharacterized protein n=1 Tax=Hwanghaeella grinnelliae TaxID=2500179 RepID=A0A437QPS8_9PROT|nr:hypothetical protein [Hwanghaeella grinnelliae]RVU36480.1 hypothetical protein EOI86_14905 [Hwanghaeella grinnelliae]